MLMIVMMIIMMMIFQHQNPQQLSANLWAAVRARGCQVRILTNQRPLSTNKRPVLTNENPPSISVPGPSHAGGGSQAGAACPGGGVSPVKKGEFTS